jgi:2-oxoglutarate ferredoxin oxidoreductase subunit delta
MATHVTVDTDRCTGCGLCIPVCPNNLFVEGTILNATGERPVVMVDAQYCLNKLDCLAVCPHDALIPPDTQESNVAGAFYWMGRQLGKASRLIPPRLRGDTP